MTQHGHDGGLSVYVSLLRLPHAARSAITGVIGQFPYPFLGMGLLIAIREGYGSYTLAGIVSSVMALTSAFTGPIVGRLIDRHGQKRVGLPLAAFWIASISFMSAALHYHWPSWLLVLGGILLGTSVPYSSMIRGRWTFVLADRPGRLNSALSLTSTLEELMWVIGNPTATVLATSVAMLSPMAAAIVAILISAWGFLLDDAIAPPPTAQTARQTAVSSQGAHDASDTAEPTVYDTPRSDSPEASARSSRAPLFTIGFVALLAIQVAYGAFIASTNVSVVSLAQELGQPAQAGTVIACFSAASMLGAIGYGARVWSSPLWVRFYIGMTIVAVGSSFLLMSHSLFSAAAILFVAGLAQAPTVVNVNQLLIRMTPQARFTEAMAMLGAMFVVGMAVSNLVSGRLVDLMGSRGGMLSLVAFALTALAIGVVAIRPIRSAVCTPAIPQDILHPDEDAAHGQDG